MMHFELQYILMMHFELQYVLMMHFELQYFKMMHFELQYVLMMHFEMHYVLMKHFELQYFVKMWVSTSRKCTCWTRSVQGFTQLVKLSTNEICPHNFSYTEVPKFGVRFLNKKIPGTCSCSSTYVYMRGRINNFADNPRSLENCVIRYLLQTFFKFIYLIINLNSYFFFLIFSSYVIVL